jgi:hypothetical protein
MRRLLIGALLLCSLLPASAFADSITIGLAPNDGSGDNFGFQLQGAGYSVMGGGGLPYDNFNAGPPGYAPGSEVNIAGPIFFDFGLATIGSSSVEVDFGLGSLSASPITLPTNGQSFTGLVDISFGASGTLFTTGQPISVSGDAQGYITFDYINGGYYPESLELTGVGQVTPALLTPEPGTLALIGTGLLGIFACTRGKVSART